MAAYHVSPLEVQRAIQGANVASDGGRVPRRRPADSRSRPASRSRPPRQLSDLVVGVFDGRPVFLKDVADVEDGPDEVASYVRHGWGAGPRVHARTSSSRARSWAKPRRARRSTSDEPAVAAGGDHRHRQEEGLERRLGGRRACCGEAEELRGEIVPDDMELVVTRNYGLTADEKVNELVEGLAVAIVIVVALLTLGPGLARGADRGGGGAGRLRADAGGEPAARLHDQPRHAVRPDPVAGPAGR